MSKGPIECRRLKDFCFFPSNSRMAFAVLYWYYLLLFCYQSLHLIHCMLDKVRVLSLEVQEQSTSEIIRSCFRVEGFLFCSSFRYLYNSASDWSSSVSSTRRPMYPEIAYIRRLCSSASTEPLWAILLSPRAYGEKSRSSSGHPSDPDQVPTLPVAGFHTLQKNGYHVRFFAPYTKELDETYVILNCFCSNAL